MQRMFRSFEKNAKERENVAFFWKERMPNRVLSVWLILRIFWNWNHKNIPISSNANKSNLENHKKW